MGLDLTLIPDTRTYNGRTLPTPARPLLAYTRLKVEGRYYGLFTELREAAIPYRESIRSYEDGGIQTMAEDPDGARLTYIIAGELAKIMGQHDLNDEDSALRVYLTVMNPYTKIILWWS